MQKFRVCHISEASESSGLEYIGIFPSIMRDKLPHLLTVTHKNKHNAWRSSLDLGGNIKHICASLTDPLVVCKSSNFNWVLGKNGLSISSRL